MDKNNLRWLKLNEIITDFTYIKKQIRKEYGYDIKENSVLEFKKSINDYKEINEDKLLSQIEEYTYQKMSIFIMRELKNKTKHPIQEELENNVFKDYFKKKNRIFMEDGMEYSGDLDSCYKVVNYSEIDKCIKLKLSCIKRISCTDTDEDGIQSANEIEEYDCVKFIINLESKLIFMFYNDFKFIDNDNKCFTLRKQAFYKLFSNATRGNILTYDISRELNDYFKEYLSEIKGNNPKKLISEIETSNILGRKNSVKSIAHDFKHNMFRLEAISNAVNNEGHYISSLECSLGTNLIRIKSSGEVIVETLFLNQEVLEIVCKEFFKDNNLYEL